MSDYNEAGSDPLVNKPGSATLVKRQECIINLQYRKAKIPLLQQAGWE